MNTKGMFGWFVVLLVSAGPAWSEAPPAIVPVTPAATPVSADAKPDPIWDHGCGASSCPQPISYWFTAEDLLWWTKKQPLPVPVLSTGPLSDPTSVVLLGGADPFDQNVRQGGRFTLGGFFGCEKRFGIEGSYFFLGERSDHRSVNSSGAGDSFVTGVPSFVIGPGGTGAESFFFLANPGRFSSNTSLEMANFLQGYEINGLLNLMSGCSTRVDLIAGYRYLDLKERLTLVSLSPAIPPEPADDFTILDEFKTRNQFYGGQVGVRFEATRGRFFVNGSGKVAVGDIHEEVNIAGFFRTVTPTSDTTVPGGALTASSNLGRHKRDEVAWVPEATFNVGFQVNNNIRIFGGYNFLWISNVLRPGDQIDRVFTATAPGVPPTRPAVPFNDSTFWAQGINFGVQIRY